MTDGGAARRRLSICRQLSSAWKSKRQSYTDCHSPTSKFTWNCTLTDGESPSNGCFVSQKSVSYDDVATHWSETHATFAHPDLCLETINLALAKTSAGKERKEKRNSTGSAILPSVSDRASTLASR